MSWTRNLKKLIRSIVKEELSIVRTHIPAQVISYDADTNLAKVQPCIKGIRIDDPNNTTTKQLPVLTDVPVQQFGSGKCLISIAPQEGSYGLLHISDRDIQKWLDAGGINDPGSIRKFDLSDAFFAPGLYPTAADGNNGKIDVDIKTDRIEMRTRTGNSFVAVIDDENIAITATDEVTINGGTDYAVAYTDLKTAFDQLKSDFDNFVTVTYNTHTHICAAPGVASAVPVPAGTASTADMSGARVDKVRLP